jgi:hypothetical protein
VAVFAKREHLEKGAVHRAKAAGVNEIYRLSFLIRVPRATVFVTKRPKVGGLQKPRGSPQCQVKIKMPPAEESVSKLGLPKSLSLVLVRVMRVDRAAR